MLAAIRVHSQGPGQGEITEEILPGTQEVGPGDKDLTCQRF